MRYCMVQDDDCHWYVIPKDMLDSWFRFVDEADDCPTIPAWAHEVGGSYTAVTFEKVEIFGEPLR